MRCSLVLLLLGLSQAVVPPRSFDVPLPTSIRICAQIFPPFIVPSAWRSLAWSDLGHALPGFAGTLSGIVYSGANATALDGFDVAYARLVLKQMLNSASAVHATLPTPLTPPGVLFQSRWSGCRSRTPPASTPGS